jgi:hypothetical protein
MKDLIYKTAYAVMLRNQCEFSCDDDKARLIYALAFNDGVMELADKLIEALKNAEEVDNGD